MATGAARILNRKPPDIPLLRHGERLTQKEFHRRYEAFPDKVKFELIGGIVYQASREPWPAGTYRAELSALLGTYEARTPGVEAAANSTVILGPNSEPQPNMAMRIIEECGSRARLDTEGYLVGPPQLIAEISNTNEKLDLELKKADYEQAGVLEYIVLALKQQQLYWFDLKSGRKITPKKGIYRSKVFPGLWIDGPALLARDSGRLIEVVQQELASPEHERFVKRLQAKRGR